LSAHYTVDKRIHFTSQLHDTYTYSFNGLATTTIATAKLTDTHSYGVLLHGEAVAIGTHMAAVMSAKLGWIEPELAQRAVALMTAAQLPVELPAAGGMTPDKFADAMAIDKKVSDGHLRLILLKGSLGGCVFTGDYDAAAMRETIEEFCSRQ
jgi:3-dehydroquinate synthase